MKIVQAAITEEEVYVVTEDGRLLTTRLVKGRVAWVDITPEDGEVLSAKALLEEGVAFR